MAVKKTARALVTFAMALAVVSALCPVAGAQNLIYPKTKRDDHVDTYFGETVPDPYRWLEDDKSPETAKWVEEENKLTFSYLEQIPFRPQVKARLEKLYNYPKYDAPFRRGAYYF